MSANAFSQKDYENETAQRPKKTNPIKPNFRQEMPKMPYLPALLYLRFYDINLRPFVSIKINEAIFRKDQSKRF